MRQLRLSLEGLLLHVHPRAVPADALAFRRTLGAGGATLVLVVVAAVTGALLLAIREWPNADGPLRLSRVLLATVLVQALESAVLTAANKKYRNTRDLEAHFNNETGEVELYEFVTVVEEVQNSYQEIGLDEARESDPEAQLGDSLGMKLEDAGNFSRIAAQTAKQVIIQKVREAEREGI